MASGSIISLGFYDLAFLHDSSPAHDCNAPFRGIGVVAGIVAYHGAFLNNGILRDNCVFDRCALLDDGIAHNDGRIEFGALLHSDAGEQNTIPKFPVDIAALGDDGLHHVGVFADKMGRMWFIAGVDSPLVAV